MTAREYNAIAGRFITLESTEDHVIVGLIGSLYRADLTGDQLRHIKGFCSGRPFYKHHWIFDHEPPINKSMYNDFLYIDKRNPLPDYFNKYQKADFWSACEKIDRIESVEDFYSVLWDLGYYTEAVATAALEYMGCMCEAQYR